MLADAPQAFWTQLEDVRDRSEQEWREDLARGRVMLQALDGDEVAGGLGVDLEGYTEELRLPTDTVNIVSVYVRPAHRGRGVVQALMREAAVVMRENGRTRLLLEVAHTNLPARRRYVRMGFTETGRVEGHPRYPGVVEVEYAADLDGLRL